jgi:hypothetical protein
MADERVPELEAQLKSYKQKYSSLKERKNKSVELLRALKQELETVQTKSLEEQCEALNNEDNDPQPVDGNSCGTPAQLGKDIHSILNKVDASSLLPTALQ